MRTRRRTPIACTRSSLPAPHLLRFRLQPPDIPDPFLGSGETRLSDVQQFTEHQVDGVLVVAASGAVDMLTAPALQDVMTAAADRHPAGLILDMTDVEFLGSAGMQVLMTTRKRLGAETRFAVVADGPATSRPLTITGIADYIEMFSSLEGALTNFAD